MTQYQSQTSTNTKRDSRHDVKGYLMPARAFFFVVTEEPGRDGFYQRNVYASYEDPFLQQLDLTPEQLEREVEPEKFGMAPKNPGTAGSVAEHVMGKNLSSYLSASTILPGGSPRFIGKNTYIDIKRAKKAGAKIVSTDEILQALEQYKAQYPGRAARVDKIAGWVRDIDKEVLIQTDYLPPSGIFTRESLRRALRLSMYVRVVQVFGIAFTAYDLEEAAEESFKTHRAKPIQKEIIRQAGGWGASMAGFRIGAAAGAAFGIETGPGSLITGAIGGIIFGTIGYFGGGEIASKLGN